MIKTKNGKQKPAASGATKKALMEKAKDLNLDLAFPIEYPNVSAPRPDRLAHVVFNTPRFESMIDFWRTLLAADINFRNHLLCFLSFDEEHHRIALVNMPNFPDAPRETSGLDHIAFTYASLGELLANYERLRQMNIHPYWCINHGPTTSMYYRDPDGNKVELQVDNFATMEELALWFAEGSFEENSIGVDFDPAQLAADYQSGLVK